MFGILGTAGQTITPALTSNYQYSAPYYGASKAIDGDFTTNFRTDRMPSGLILTLAQPMLIRRVRVFTGQVYKK